MTELDIIFPIHLPKPTLFCKVFEGNEACWPQVSNSLIKVEVVHVPTDQQIMDTMTKHLEYQLFKKFRYRMALSGARLYVCQSPSVH